VFRLLDDLLVALYHAFGRTPRLLVQITVALLSASVFILTFVGYVTQ
jgi:hypothetical protein